MADRIPTLADVCSAIAEGRLAATTDGSTYHVNAYELRRYFNRFRALPTVPASLVPDSAQLSHTSSWSASVPTSVA